MNYVGKGSKGRETRSAGKVPDVEDLPCGDAHHRLANRAEGGCVVTRCDGCGQTWAAIDAKARVDVPARIRAGKPRRRA